MSRWTALGLFAVAALPWNAALSQTANSRPAAVPAPRALVDQYCVVCHNQKSATAGVVLNGIDFSNVGGNAALLERVLRKFRTGEMPPAGMPRPAAPASAAFTKFLEESLDRVGAANPNPGPPCIA
jgi:mono/diheme cytochrome c family protein